MFRNFAKISGGFILLLFVNFMGCGDADKVGQIPAEELLQISNVLDRWREGYETEDVNDLYRHLLGRWFPLCL